MNHHRITVSAIGVAVAGASVLGLSAPALAATPGVTYVTAADIVQTNVAGDAGWTKFPGSTFSSSISGLAMPSGRIVSYGVATPISASTGTAVSDFARATTYSSSSDLDIFPGITLFDVNGVDNLIFGFDGTASLSDPLSQWFPTNPIGALPGPFTLAELDLELSTNASLVDWTIESFSMEPMATVGLYTTTVNGERFSFLPQPVSAAPTTIAQTALASTGITVTTTGFLPNEPVEFSLDGGTSSSAGQADASGGFSFTRATAASAGAHTLALRGTTSAVVQSFAFTVTAAAVPAPALAATGANTGTPAGLAAGGALVLGGSALVVMASRRRRTV